MRSRNETELWLHEWCGPTSFRTKVRVATGLVLGVIFGLQVRLPLGVPAQPIFGPIVGLGLMLLFMLSGERVLKTEPAYRVPFNPRQLAVSLVIGLVGGLTIGLGRHLRGWSGPLLIGLIAGFIFMLTSVQGIKPISAYRTPIRRLRLIIFLTISFAALVVALSVGRAGLFVGGVGAGGLEAFIGGLIIGVIAWQALKRGPIYRSPIYPRPPVVSLAARLFFGLTLELIYAMIVENLVAKMTLHAGLVRCLLVGVLVGVPVALAGGLVAGLVSFGPDRQRVAPGSPTQLIVDSGQIGLLVGLLVSLLIGMARVMRVGLVVGLSEGLSTGMVVGLIAGLDSVLYHFTFRLWLRGHHRGPLRWVTFLEWANVHLLLRRTGASYQWAHLELREYLAVRWGPRSKVRSK